MANEVNKCKRCGDNYFVEDLIWGDKGNFYLICQDCWNFERRLAV
jgi:hypothetical protein